MEIMSSNQSVIESHHAFTWFGYAGRQAEIAERRGGWAEAAVVPRLVSDELGVV
jgi:hypothetical protein